MAVVIESSAVTHSSGLFATINRIIHHTVLAFSPCLKKLATLE